MTQNRTDLGKVVGANLRRLIKGSAYRTQAEFAYAFGAFDGVADKDIEVSLIHGTNPSRISRTDCEGWERVSKAVASTWRGSIVSPYLMVQCSDSRHYGRISDKVYRFSAMDLTSEERATIHGNNERIRVEALEKTIEFYIRIMRMS